ncbi:hypothetical protein [Pontibacter cellulosilyticus]|uniref:Uncharacterized protein n=1 Tax=Pontibacter cellulosilyticus TaxID=1720253 RepID=A0A923NA92_9BACT|nr:hypothetical protein [Pontibacter cellulosilyticus]MBC5993260.1 hypothetical protein [Pontibacter cellulosilyticus]
MKTNIAYITGAFLISIVSCTSLSEGQESLPPGVVTEQRVSYREGLNTDVRVRMNEQASEINRKRNIEEFDRNEPAMTPPTLRPQHLPYSPIDSTRHTIYWPIRPVIRPIRVIPGN